MKFNEAEKGPCLSLGCITSSSLISAHCTGADVYVAVYVNFASQKFQLIQNSC